MLRMLRRPATGARGGAAPAVDDLIPDWSLI